MKLDKFALTILFTVGLIGWLSPSLHASAYDLRQEARSALSDLYDDHPKAAELGSKATAILVFPKIVKAGFIFGAQGGEGVLFKNGHTDGYYRTSSVSYGLQAGVQKYGYVMFFMNHEALAYLYQSNGWEVGVGPSIVIVDEGTARNMSTTTLHKDVYAFIFSQKGLMAGLGLQGTKVTQFYPDE